MQTRLGEHSTNFTHASLESPPFEQITTADPNSADAGIDELMAKFEAEVQVDNAEDAGCSGTTIVEEADEEGIL